ncbi:MAG: hypothetical protein IKD94_03250 [Erysipelotrichaceae bacterium]|nr:hypothetical protein [Erysipelotrichaceae bacterium]
MDIYKYIPSQDVIDHLKSIDYGLSALQLVRIMLTTRKQIPLRQVHADLKEIMSSYEDEYFPTLNELLGLKKRGEEIQNKKSLFEMIREKIEDEGRLLEDFYKPDGLYDAANNFLFSSYEDMEKRFFEEKKEERFGFADDDNTYKIEKRYVDSDRILRVTMNSCFEPVMIMEIYDDYGMSFFPSIEDNAINVAYKAFPLPFENGDIVTSVTDDQRKPMVIIDDEYDKQNHGKDHFRAYGVYDIDNINCYKCEDGRLYFDHYDPIDLIRYTGEENDDYKPLKVLQEYVKENIEFTLFLPAFIAALHNQRDYFGQEYLKDICNGEEWVKRQSKRLKGENE